ncbi:NERD domain-containing protein [Nocardia sp. NBC_00508]|uniref:NERD domain-containing protein n=1 Tax=Nocardia sp. NBC_00508 TaxID=2975992 RepID=UPI002E8009C0|nr:NERD domain-containing protein [Nocardia sp. NBC_00508]WUD69001.1 NERD domain-containing protein [Nocardia sp. NBC_00508]
MLVRIRPGAELSGAEREFVACLRSYPTTGLAVIDLEADNRRVDAVVWTPRGLTVLEVHGFRRRQSGILSTPADEPWKISDAPVELDDLDSGSPADRVEHGIYAVKHMLQRALQDPGHLSGAVVLVPFRGAVVRPARTNLRPGLDVLVGNVTDATELRIYLEGFSAGPRNWTVDRVIGACDALGLAELAPSRAELLDAGFEENAPEPTTMIPRRPEPRVEPTPGVATKSQAYAGWSVVVVAVVGVLLVLGVIASALVQDSAQPAPATDTTTSPTPSPPPYRPAECWPFQSNC